MSKLTIMVGLPACGKSTYVQKILEPKTVYISTDAYLEMKATELGLTYNDVFTDYIKEATSVMEGLAKNAIAQKQDVIWDQTNLTAKKRRSIMSRFPKSYRVECVVMKIPTKPMEFVEWKKRLDGRPGKTIPKHIMVSMGNSYQEPTADENFSEITYVNSFEDSV